MRYPETMKRDPLPLIRLLLGFYWPALLIPVVVLAIAFGGWSR
jgi:hypothetical protein